MLSPSFLWNNLLSNLKKNPFHPWHSAPISSRRAVVTIWRDTYIRVEPVLDFTAVFSYSIKCGHWCCQRIPYSCSKSPPLTVKPFYPSSQVNPVRLTVTYPLPLRLPNLHSLPACHHSFWDERGPFLIRYYGKCLCRTPYWMGKKHRNEKLRVNSPPAEYI